MSGGKRYGAFSMGSSPESDISVPVKQQEEHNSAWSIADLFNSSRALTPALDSRNPIENNSSHQSSPGRQEERSILGNFSVGSPEGKNAQATSPDSQAGAAGDKARAEASALGAGSFGDKLAGIISKIGQFLESVVPPEYQQYVRQYLPMAEQFIGNLLKDFKFGEGPNGSKHVEAELKQSRTIPDVLPDTSLEVDPKIGFDVSAGANGAEINNIKGLHLKGPNAGEVRSGRLDFNGGEPTLNVTVAGADGQTNEVPIPLPSISDIMSQFEQQQ
jgi:hypothetical protein